MEAFARLLEAVAWPSVVAWSVWILRDALQRTIDRITRLKGPGFETELGEVVRRAEREAENANLPPVTEIKNLPLPEQPTDKYRRLCEVSPRAAIIEGWREIELAVADRFPRSEVYFSPMELRETLQRSQLLDKPSLILLDDLRQVRNHAAHSTRFEISSEESYRLALIATRLAAKIRDSDQQV